MDESLYSPALPPLRRRGFGCVAAFLGLVLILSLLTGFLFYEAGNTPLRAFRRGQ